MCALATGCASASLSQLAATPPPQDPFYDTLTREYLALAQFEEAQYDWKSTGIFAAKGLRAASEEKDIDPEPLNRWHVPDRRWEELFDARIRLMEALYSGNRAQYPTHAALALASFDCWLEQTAEAHQVRDIKACRDKFYLALNTLDGGSFPDTQVSHADRLEAEEHIVDVRLPQTHLVFFNPGSTELTQEAMEVIDAIIAVIESLEGHVAISIIGHSDTRGSADLNEKAALDRALAVDDALRGANIELDRIDIESRGESEPLVNTGDNVAEALNRRVEIILE